MCDILAGGKRDLLQVRRLMIAAMIFTFLALETTLIPALLGLASKLKAQNSGFGEDFQLDGIIVLNDNSTATILVESNAKDYLLVPLMLLWILACCCAISMRISNGRRLSYGVEFGYD